MPRGPAPAEPQAEQSRAAGLEQRASVHEDQSYRLEPTAQPGGPTRAAWGVRTRVLANVTLGLSTLSGLSPAPCGPPANLGLAAVPTTGSTGVGPPAREHLSGTTPHVVDEIACSKAVGTSGLGDRFEPRHRAADARHAVLSQHRSRGGPLDNEIRHHRPTRRCIRPARAHDEFTVEYRRCCRHCAGANAVPRRPHLGRSSAIRTRR